MKKIALLIGVSEYQPPLKKLASASRDIEAMKRILENPGFCKFDEVKTLLDPEDGEARYAIEQLFTTELGKNDLGLLYFSGHGIKDQNNKLYFATGNTQKNPEGDLIISTAVEADFVYKIMGNSRAKRQIVILDCCFSGAIDPSLQAKDDGSIDLRGQLGAEGRVILTSSSSTQYSFEHKESDLSVYTHHLVEGIESGAADKDRNGKISIAELHDYLTQKVQEDVPDISPKIIVIKDQGYEMVFAESKFRNTQQDCHNLESFQLKEFKKIDPTEIRLNKKQKEEPNYYSSIPSLLLSIEPFIERLIEQIRSSFFSHKQSQNLTNIASKSFILEWIRRAADIDFVFLMRNPTKGDIWKLEAQSDLREGINGDIYNTLIQEKVLMDVSVESIFSVIHYGMYRTFHDEKTSDQKTFILVPIIPQSEFIVICGLSKNSAYLNDAFAKAIASFYSSSQKFYYNPSRIEAEILDELKLSYGFLPIAFYERRFELFCDRLEKITIHFEPILDLKKVQIKGWEALARDPESVGKSGKLAAPVDLFKAAELWGRKFILQLDMTLLERAVESYRLARSEAKMNRLADIRDLSVNVYPESLMRTQYFESVRKVVTPDATGSISIPADSLVLEISEKTRLPTHNNGTELESPLETFKERLLKYVHELEIRFGIDDFGVGHASVSRLACLRPPFVKIDRDILHQQQADTIIKFVREIVKKSSELHVTQVIMEGVDEHSPVTLSQLNKLGISYVQGYVVDRSGPTVSRLPQEKRQELSRLIHGR